MVFEASCWVSSPMGLSNSYNNCTNPIQQRTKINFFDTSTVNATSTISHISSNGYYGYCPAGIHVNDSQRTPPIIHANRTDDIDADMAIDDNAIVSKEAHQSIQGQHPIIENRKRQLSSTAINYDAKRSRPDRKADTCDGMYHKSIR